MALGAWIAAPISARNTCVVHRLVGVFAHRPPAVDGFAGAPLLRTRLRPGIARRIGARGARAGTIPRRRGATVVEPDQDEKSALVLRRGARRHLAGIGRRRAGGSDGVAPVLWRRGRDRREAARRRASPGAPVRSCLAAQRAQGRARARSHRRAHRFPRPARFALNSARSRRSCRPGSSSFDHVSRYRLSAFARRSRRGNRLDVDAGAG